MNTNINKRKQIINFYTKLTYLLKGLFLLGLLGSLVSCGGAESSLEGIQGVATLGDQITTNVSSDSSIDEYDDIHYYIDVDGLTNERHPSGTQGSLTLTEYSGGNVVKEQTFSFSDPMGIIDAYENVGDYVSSNDGESYQVYVNFEDNLRGVATFGNQTTREMSFDYYSGTYHIGVSGLTNEPGSSGTEGSLTLTEYSRGNIVKQEILNFMDPSGEDSDSTDFLAGFVDSFGDSYNVTIWFEARQ